MSGADEDGTTDGLVGALGERLSAELERGATTLRLALAETRLAASSAALLVGIVLACAVLALVVWLLLVALVAHALWWLGLPIPLVLLLLIGVHVLAALVLALVARRLLRDLRFAHTRRALADARPGRAPPGDTSDSPVPPVRGPDADAPSIPRPAAPGTADRGRD